MLVNAPEKGPSSATSHHGQRRAVNVVRIRAEPGEALKPEARLPALVTLASHCSGEAQTRPFLGMVWQDSRKSWRDTKGSEQVDSPNTSKVLAFNKPFVTILQPH